MSGSGTGTTRTPKSTPTLEQLTDSDEKLTLWNFPVTGADLGPAPRQVLEKFAGPGLMAETPEHPRIDFYVEGHASVTGRGTSNRDYAEERAKNVAAFLTGLGIQKVRFESAGSSQRPTSRSLPRRPQSAARSPAGKVRGTPPPRTFVQQLPLDNRW